MGLARLASRAARSMVSAAEGFSDQIIGCRVGRKSMTGGACDPDGDIRDDAILHGCPDSYADNGIATRGVPDLAVPELSPRIRAGNMDRDKDFVDFQRGRENINEEVRCPDAPGAAGTCYLQFSLQRDNDGWPVGRRIPRWPASRRWCRDCAPGDRR